MANYFIPPGGDGGGVGVGGGGGYYYPHFLDGEGIERSVIHMDLPRYLGPNTISKPGEREGIEGFWYGGGRMLTEAQIRSLKADSARFRAEQEVARAYRRYPGLNLDYGHSEAFQESLHNNPDGNNPDANKPDGRYPEGRYPDGRYPEGREPEGRYIGGRELAGREPGGRYPDPREPDGRYLGGREPSGREPGGREPGGRYNPGERYPDARYPDSRYPDNRYPDPRYPDGRYPERHTPGERYPGGREPGGREPGGREPGGREPGGRPDLTYGHPLPVAAPWPEPNILRSLGEQPRPALPQPEPGQDPRYLYMPPPDGRPWYDSVRGVYLPPFSPPDPAAS